MTNREAALATTTRLLNELDIIEMKVESQPENVGVWRAQLGIAKADGVRALQDDYSPQAAELLAASHGRGDPDLTKVIRSEIERYREVVRGLHDHAEDYGVATNETPRLLHPQVRERRRKVANLWKYGLNIAEIADSLWIGESTVKRDLKVLGLKDKK